MNEDATLFPIFVESNDGITYAIEPFAATRDNIDELWEKSNEFTFLFSDFLRDDKANFAKYFLSPGVLVLQVSQFIDAGYKPVGIAYFDQVIPRARARGHYLFWDRVQKGREILLLHIAKWFFDEFEVNRIGFEVPWYAYSVLRNAHRMRLTLEGLRYGSVLFNGVWRDELLFCILKKDITPEALKTGKLAGDTSTSEWFGLLDSHDALARNIFRKES